MPELVATYKDTPIYHDASQQENTVITCNKPKTMGYQGLLYIGENGVYTREDGTLYTQEKTEYYVSCFIVNEPDPEKAVLQIEKMMDLQQKFSEHLINKARRVYEKLQELGIESTYSHNLKLREAYNHIKIGSTTYKITHEPDGQHHIKSNNPLDKVSNDHSHLKDLKSILEKLVELKKKNTINLKTE